MRVAFSILVRYTLFVEIVQMVKSGVAIPHPQ